MKFSEFAKYILEIEKTASRLEITRLLSELFKKLSPSEIEKTIYLLMGRVAPLYKPSEIGMAEKMVSRSVVSALNIEKKYFEKEYKRLGDLGTAVEKFKSECKSFDEKDLEVEEVFDSLSELAKKNGLGSQEAKVNILSHLIRQLDPLSAKYLVRIPLGVMRLGFSDRTVLDALSWMIKGDKTFRVEIERAYHVRPDLGDIGRIIKEGGVKKLKKIEPELYTPILMMRAERLSSGKEIIEKIGQCVIEPKYDGFRLQVHYKKDHDVKLYSRNLEDVSFMYPDLVEGIRKQVHVDEVIFEGEAIGFDPYTGGFLPFQETVQRKRKYGIEDKVKEIPLRFFSFDLLYLNKKNYLNVPFSKRAEDLRKVIKGTGDTFKDIILITKDTIVEDPKKIEILFDDALSKGLEGVIAKRLNGVYQAGARNWNWIKFKRSYSSKIEDTIDCLVLGYDVGYGKRQGLGIGAFLAGVYDEKKDQYVTIAKIGTGLTDEEWRALKVKSSKLKVKDRPKEYTIDKMMNCDVWLKPAIVVEVKADEITRSPVHTAGREGDLPGYALRFPRLEKFRDDKKPSDATSLKEIKSMFKRQKVKNK